MSRPAKQQDKPDYAPPSDPEAEQAVLGAILIRPEVLDEVAGLLVPADFYREAHGYIFQTIIDLYGKSEPVDYRTVVSLLKDRGQLAAVGGADYIVSLSEQVGFAANAGAYARKVRDKATLRRTLEAAQQIAGACLSPVENLPEFLDGIESQIYQVAHARQENRAYSVGELGRQNYERLETLYNQRVEAHGLKTGYYDYDRLTAGLHPGELTILAARPSMGKTALALNIAWQIGKHKIPVLIFSLEMSREHLLTRLTSSAGRIEGDNLRRARLSPDNWMQLSDLQARFDEATIFIDDTSSITALELRAGCRRIAARHGLSLVIVDYLQLMRSPKLRSREEEISKIAYDLKALSKELSVPVMAVSQVSREIEKRTGRKYQLSDLRESGAIEQAADNVLFLYREKDGVVADLDLAKQRNGRVGQFELGYSAVYCRFENYAGGV